VSLDDDPVARARALARTVEALAEVAEKYRLLQELGSGTPGRTDERRAAMRAIADRFPGALREWDVLAPDELAHRRAEAERALTTILDGTGGAAAALAAPHNRWLALSITLHARLREALRIKRFLAGRPARGPLLDETAAAFGVDRARVEAVARPPAGRVSELVYREVAREAGLSVDQLKAALYPPGDAPPGGAKRG
jgi:hypothetical protein